MAKELNTNVLNISMLWEQPNSFCTAWYIFSSSHSNVFHTVVVYDPAAVKLHLHNSLLHELKPL